MPTATSIDWPLAKEFYVNGMSPSDIAKRMGIKLDTLCSKISRQRWQLDRLSTQPAQDLVVKTVAERISQRALDITERVLIKCEKMGMGNPREAKDIATAASSAYATARKALGLDDEKGNRTFSVTIVNGSLAGVAEQTGPLIDVTPEPDEASSPASPDPSPPPSS